MPNYGKLSSLHLQSTKDFLIKNYPIKGKQWCMKELGMTEGVVRGLCTRLKLKQNRTSDFFKDWQARARIGKIQPKIKRICEACGKEFFRTKSQVKFQPYRFCSRECAWTDVSKRHKRDGHPKGMLGKHHTNENKELFRNLSTGRKKSRGTIMKMLKTKELRGTDKHYRPECSWKTGRADDLGDIHFRSSWERNYARYLNFLIKKKQIKSWEYEKETFWFEKIKRGVVSYKPDFRVINNNGTVEYHEVKGWMDARSATKLKRMRIYHPEIKMVLVDSREYKQLAKMGKLFSPLWE